MLSNIERSIVDEGPYSIRAQYRKELEVAKHCWRTMSLQQRLRAKKKLIRGSTKKTPKKESTKWTFSIRCDCDTKEKEPKTSREDTPEANKPMHSLLPWRIPVLPFGAFNIDKKRSRV